MVSPSKPNHPRVASQQQSHKCKLIKGPKPLINFRFYLDIEKHQIESKIERTIRELGGSIEFFLAKEVTHFVTDKQIDHNGKIITKQSPISQKTPKTPQIHHTATSLILSDFTDIASPNGSANDVKATCSNPQSRADAMLQRARTVKQQPTSNENSVRCSNSNVSRSPIQLARSWGTSIWTIEYTLKFLEKVSLAVKFEYRGGSSIASPSSSLVPKNKTANAKHLKGDFIKIESTAKHYRPYYQEFKNWPVLNLNNTGGYSPFNVLSDKTVQQNKLKTKQTVYKVENNYNSSAARFSNNIYNKNNNNNNNSNRNKNNNNFVNKSEMTRKTRNKQVRETVDACSIKSTDIIKRSSEKCGYCEKCRVEYDVLSVHLQSKEHLNFVKNNDNYLALDSLINNSANVETFIKMNSTHKNSVSPTSPTNTKLSTDIDSGLFGRHTIVTGTRSLTNNVLHNNCEVNIKIEVNTEDNEFKNYEQTNGISNDQFSQKITRDMLPKYSPPMTRRSYSKQPILNNKTEISPSKCNNVKEVEHNGDCNILLRARRETQKRINYTDSKEDEENFKDTENGINLITNKKTKVTKEENNDDESPQVKRLVRSFPRYKVVDEDKSSAKSSNEIIVNKKLKNIKTEPVDKTEETDPATGLIVKFKRVRESELSKLTHEADNFMFPKPREDIPTDEDRQSTSEAAGDASIELLSSELEESKFSPPTMRCSMTDNRNPYTIGARRNKRKTQYDSSSHGRSADCSRSDRLNTRRRAKENPVPKSSAKETSLASKKKLFGHSKVTRRSTKSAAKSEAKQEEGKHAMNLDESGDNIYNDGSLLSTQRLQQYKFSFERIPNNEPWFLAFQRQDESREKIFEYWGSTAYRKLPFELGPLPPLKADCCILNKLDAIRTAKQEQVHMNKRGRRKKLLTSTSSCSNHVDDKTNDDRNLDNDLPLASTSSQATSTRSATVTRSTPKATDRSTTSGLTAKKNCESILSDEERKANKSSRKDGLSTLLLKNKQLNNVSSAISAKKKTALLDAFGHPRKSPREHASTLAILSSLVQQRRKRIKEYYGISPEKLQLSETNGTSEVTDNDDEDGDENYDNDSYTIKDEEDLDDEQSQCSTSNRRSQSRLNSKLSSDTNDKANETVTNSLASGLPKSKRRLLKNDSSASIETQDMKNERARENCKDIDEIKLPKIPTDDYQDPNKIAEHLDSLLSSCYLEADHDLRDIEIPTDECKDLILVNTPKDFVEIITSVKEGPLSYRSLTSTNKKPGFSLLIHKGKKRRNNKTGWPSLPKKRVVPKRSKNVGKSIEDVATSNTEDDDNQSASVGALETEGDRIDISNRLLQNKSDEFLIQSREYTPLPSNSMRKQDPFASDYDEFEEEEADGDDEEDEEEDDDETRYCLETDTVNNVFSSSEKTENSDMFTVSSDSLDTTDLVNDTIASNKNDESINHSDDSLSDSTSIADLIQKKKQTSILRTQLTNSLTSSKMETRAKSERTLNQRLNNSRLTLQPVVYMRKINEKDIYRRTYKSSSISPQKTRVSPTKQSPHQSTVNNRNSCSPRTKVSPRKLRKPRGRWYRER